MCGESLGSLGGLGGLEARWEERRRFEGEKVTVAEILGGGVDGFGREEGNDEEDEVLGEVDDDDGALGLGAKKRDMTCCFSFPMVAVSDPLRSGAVWDGDLL